MRFSLSTLLNAVLVVAVFLGLRAACGCTADIHWVPPLTGALVAGLAAVRLRANWIRTAAAAASIAAAAAALILMAEFSWGHPEYLRWDRTADLRIIAMIAMFHALIGSAVGAFVGGVIRIACS